MVVNKLNISATLWENSRTIVKATLYDCRLYIYLSCFMKTFTVANLSNHYEEYIIYSTRIRARKKKNENRRLCNNYYTSNIHFNPINHLIRDPRRKVIATVLPDLDERHHSSAGWLSYEPCHRGHSKFSHAMKHLRPRDSSGYVCISNEYSWDGWTRAR